MNTFTRQGRILIMDDEETWLDELAETLQHSDFLVDAAPTLEQALAFLEKNFYHLLVLDLRMDATDQANEDGIKLLEELAKRGLTDATKVIMLSSFGTKEQTRTVFKDYKITDFLFKDQFNNRTFVEDIRRIFSNEVKINLQLDINWQAPYGPERAIRDILVNKQRVKDGTLFQQRIIDEFIDLLCRLFYLAEGILVQELMRGKSGAGVFLVTPFYPATGAGRTVVVKFGDVHQIQKEHNNFKDHVESFVGGGRNTTILNTRHTPYLGGIAYSLLGLASEKLEDFGSFYDRAGIIQLKEALERLFMKTCNAWYSNPGHRHLHNLTTDYLQLLGLTQERLDQALERLKVVQTKTKLRFSALSTDRTFTNPLTATADVKLVQPTYVCITHGDFNPQNILVDTAENMWLIDFQRTGRGHIFHDVAELDSMIRYQLLTNNAATLEERLAMEQSLSGVDHFSQLDTLFSQCSSENQALNKAYSLVIHLRLLARRLAPQAADDDMRDYYIALLYYALNTICSYSLSVGQREHALLSASLLVDKLGL
ncbi:MAG TPA: response regulator [Ktedonosporobacter sp.]|nr:response regulator [Ktedonosporobacter sp.]